MLFKMIRGVLFHQRGKMLLIAFTIALGASLATGMLNVMMDVGDKVNQELKTYGANITVKPKDASLLSDIYDIGENGEAIAASYLREEDLGKIKTIFWAFNIVDFTPFLDTTVTLPDGTPVKLAGTWFNHHLSLPTGEELDAGVVGMRSWWDITAGKWLDEKDANADGEMMAGAVLADQQGWSVGDTVTIKAGQHEKELVIAGIYDAGGDEDQQIFATLDCVQGLTDREGRVASIEVSAITTLSIDASSQTPEIGGQVGTDKNFLSRFIGKKLPVALGEDVDAVSGATISSQAVIDALNNAHSVTKGTAAAERSGYFSVTGILVTGGEEESYIYMKLRDLEDLTQDKSLDVAELSVSANAEQLEQYVSEIDEADTGVMARLVKRVTRSETAVLGKLQALVFLVTVVVLLLTTICVSTTMMAVVSERRREIGLRKALGAPDSSIRAEFLGEGMFLGGLGGVLGALLGFVFAQVVSVNVFGSSITFQPLLLPLTLIASMLIAAVSCLLPIKRAVAIDPALVLKGE